MLRFVNICLVLALVALAYVIYEGKYEARALDEDIGGLRKDIETERDGVAVLRAEWSLLNRPERIERLAEKHLKLAPARPLTMRCRRHRALPPRSNPWQCLALRWLPQLPPISMTTCRPPPRQPRS